MHEDISRDILYSAALGYFAANQAASQVAQHASGIVEYRKPSFGNFETSAKPLYWFGIPRNVSFPGLVMDIDRYASIVVAKDNSSTVGYVKQSGMRLSAYEHLIPERLFTSTQPDQGVSAVKALAIANVQGQKIYTLNAINQASHATLLAQVTIDVNARAEIQNALAAGKEVTVHQAPITQSGWTGSGYIVTDPATGSGAYKISGGANGGVLSFLAAVLAQPSLLLPTCQGSFFDTFFSNSNTTMNTIPGMILPLGSTVFTGAAMAEWIGGATILQAISVFFVVSPYVFATVLYAAMITAVINWLFFNAVFSIGVSIGSAVGAAACRRQ